MAENKTKPTPLVVADYLNAIIDDSRRADCVAVSQLMSAATDELAQMWGAAIVGFGSYHYKYDSGREGDCCAVGFSSRKGDICVYLTEAVLAQVDLVGKLGKFKAGKACLYIRKLADVDQGVLSALIRATLAERRLQYG